MMKYKAQKAWKGSPDGCTIKDFAEGKIVDHSELGDALAEVALFEGWIVALDDAPKAKKSEHLKQVVELTLEIVKDGMTVKEMRQALKDAGIATRAKKEDALAALILEHNLFKGD